MSCQSYWFKFFFSISLKQPYSFHFFLLWIFLYEAPFLSRVFIHIGGTGEKKQGMGGRIDVIKQRICQEFQNINTLGASPTSNQQHYTVCLKYNENSPKNIKGIFCLNDCIC